MTAHHSNGPAAEDEQGRQPSDAVAHDAAAEDAPAGASHRTDRSTSPMTERQRVERFEAAYNRIDRGLAELIDRKPSDSSGARRHPFASKVRVAANRFRRLARHADFLLEIGDLRNALVHNRLDTETYLAVPSQETVEQLERIERDLFSPEKVLPRFAREVITLEADQSLAQAWQFVRGESRADRGDGRGSGGDRRGGAGGYSRYPVYEKGSFIGLLTSNGFARFVAAQMSEAGRLELDAASVPVRDVLAADHRRDLVEFVSAETLIESAAQSFIRNPRLETILITQHGKSHERPLGIICAPDIAAMEL